jgi:PBSX family phage terminase large subunit
MDDNLSLSERTKERYRNQYSGVFYQCFILGQWVMAEGVIYDMFDTQKHVVPAAEITPKLAKHSRYVSCDYGTQNATVFLLWEKGIDGVWYCTREYYYSGRDMSRQKTDSEYADDFQKWISGTSFRAMIVDPAAASFIAELRKRNIPVVSAKNDVLDGIRLVGSLLKREKIKYSDVCKNTIKEYGSYVWDEKAADRGIDAPVKQHDHAMDASRYFVMTVIGNYSARIKNKAAYGFD